jgi:fibronectin type 3 domain-containing protein
VRPWHVDFTLRFLGNLAGSLVRRPRRLAVLLAVPLLILAAGATTGARAAGTTPAEIGQWSAPFVWPNVAVHTMLEPNGKVLSIDAWDDAPNTQYVWDPATNAFTLAPYSRNLFCSGHTQIAGGKTLIVGGHVSANNGIKDTTIFDPASNSWTRGPDMAAARWYPTATELPDGRVFVFAGDDIDAAGPSVPHAFKSSSINSLPEVYNPATNSWQSLPNARLTSPLYPFLFTLTDGRIVNVGPDTVTRTITPGTWTWNTVATSSFDGGSAVMYRPDKIMKSGSYTDPDFTGADLFQTTNQTAVLDMTQASPTWRNTAPMATGRGYHVLTMLPDGQVLVTGGETASDGRDLTKSALTAEIWNPATETWTTMAAQQNGRLYHSTALLLPDGRVLVAGGGQAPGGTVTNQLNAEIYSPPYLFKGPRPLITSAPTTFNWSGTFTVNSPDAARIASVSLIKTGAMTHAINMSQRFIPLSFTAGSGSLTVQAPANSAVAPPGYYMLWIVDTNGVPSVSAMMNTSGTTVADTQAPAAPTGLAGTGGAGFANLTWTASTDNVGVVNYNVHRSTTSGFTPSAANRVAQPVGTSYTDPTLPAGTYYYKVTAQDAAGNVSAASAEASAVVTSDTIAPTVSLTAPANGATVSQSVNVSANAGDNTGVAGVQFRLDGTNYGAEDTAAPYSVAWDTTASANGSHTLTALARDGAGNTTLSGPVNVTVANSGGTTGLVAAYGFEEGIGTTTADAAGGGHTGTLSNASWTTQGKFGNALSFNGSNSFVSAPDSNGLDLTTAMTVEAWVRPSALTSWGTVVFKERPGYYAYALYANTGTNRPSGNAMIGSLDADTRGTAQLPLNTWKHLAVTYDGNMLILYVDGVQESQLLAPGSIVTSTGLLKIGGNAIWGEFFSGLIDEVRVYNRTLTGAQIQADMTRAVVSPDTTAPSAPSALTATGSLTAAQLGWAASTDDVGVVRYNVHRGTTAGFTPSAANRIAQPAGTGYTDTVAAGTYYYKVTAEDAAGNVSAASNEVSATVGDATPPGPPGTLTAAGAVGRATLAWGAATDNVAVARYNVHRGTTAGFNPSAANRIAQPTTTGYTDVTTAGTYFYKVTAEDTAGNVGPTSNEASATVTTDTTAPSVPTGLGRSVTGSTVNLTWTASTDDVGVASYNVHRGTASGFTPSAANRIGQPTTAAYADTGLGTGTYYYVVTAEDAAGNVSAASAEVSATIADATPPTAPTTLAAGVAGSTVNLTWTAATDNVGVVRYNLHRGTSSGFTPSAANRIAQPTGTSFADLNVPAGSYFYKLTAEDAAGNVGPVSNTASATVADTTAPTAPTGLVATGGAGQAALTWAAATDNIGVLRYNVHRATSAGFTPSAANRVAQPTGTSYTDTGLAAGTYYYRVTAEDTSANVGPASNEASAVVQPAAPVGLVAAYGFDEGAGTTTADQSGSGNPGTLSNATWAGAAAGRFGNALSFNGTNSIVNVADSNSLDLTNAMTLEAWVRPAVAGNAYLTVIMKERPGSDSYALYANGSGNNRAPIAEVYIGGYRDAVGTTQLAPGVWAHLAATYDGSVLALYVNGVQAAQLLIAGSMTTSTSPLRIGANTIWGEWFNGLIDEVRVYNRARTATEIQADMNAAITNPDTVTPSAPGTLSATGSLTSAQLTWGAATDNVGVTRYNVHRSTTSGFTPSAANRIAQPTGTSYTDTTAAGTYYYRVTAEDAAGNVGPASNEATAIVGDTQAPGAPGTLAAAGAVGRATLTWGAATDNVAVVRYNLHRGTSPGFTPSAANRIAQPTGTSYVDVTAAGTYYYRVTAEDAAGNVGPASNEAAATVTSDTTPPAAVTGLGATVAGSTANLAWTAATDDVGVTRYNVHRGTSAGFTPSAANRIAQPTGTTYADTGLAIGTYYYKVTAEDAAGNVGAASNEATASVADATPPTAPSGLAGAAAGSTVNLTWTAATDNVGVVRYNLHRGTTSGFTPSTANRIAQPASSPYADNGLTPGTYFYKLTAEDAAGNVGPVSNTATATVADTTAPTAPTNLVATGGAGQAALTWTAATDNVGVTRYNVHRSTTSGFTPATANRIAQPTGTSYTDTGLAAGTYYYKVTAEDAAGNVGAASTQSTATVSAPPAVGLVAAYGFDEGTGAVTADQSGTGNGGSLANVTWAGAAAGRFGNALSFNGSTSIVTVADSNSLDLTNGMTLEAWVRPTTLSNWNTVIFKEQPGYYSYALYANTGTNRPSANLYNSGDRDVRGTAQVAANSWTHVAATYDGSVLALYVNGVQNATLLTSGAIVTSTGALRIGDNTVWGEHYSGLIDEVRIYNRALSAAEIQTDMNRPVTNPDTTPPSAPTNFARTGGTATTIATSWTAATDNVAVTEYRLYRDGVQAGTSTTTTFTFTGLNCGTSSNLEVEARDAVGNASPRAALTSATDDCDVTAPGVPGTLTATGAIGRATLSWGAASDNVGVTRYNVHRGTTPGFTPSAANRIAQPTGTSYVDVTAAGTYYYRVTAEDAAGNVGSASNEASAVVTADTAAPTAPTGLTAVGGAQQVALSWTAATDNVGVTRYNVHRGTTAGFTPSAANRIAQPTGTSYTNTSLAVGTYYYRVTAEDGAGNVGPASNEASATVTNPPPAGLVAAYGLDEGSGTSTADGSGRGNTGTLSGATWTVGKFGNAANFDGVNDWVTVADSSSIDLTTGMTLEAWVLPSNNTGWRTILFKEQTNNVTYSLFSSTNTNVPRSEAVLGGTARSVNGPSAITGGVWTHLAASYDASTYRLYVNGSQVASTATSGNIAVTTGALRLGGNSVWGEYFSGRIDEVRVYNRALSQSEIQTDMNRPVTPDVTAPTVTAVTPAAGTTDVPIGVQPTAQFSEPMDTASLSAFELRDASNTLIPATVTYNDATSTATLVPTAALTYGTTYTATVKGGPAGVKDGSGNPLATDRVWSFSTESIPPPILVIGSTANKFTMYAAEILRAEGLNDFATLDISLISPAILGYYDVVVLGQMALTPIQVTTLTNWVTGGGNLIALRPDKQLAGLLGLTDAGTTLSNTYLAVNTATEPGAGIVGQTMQFHGTADRYTLNGATSVATLYTNASTATTSPAVTLRSVGSSGGQAAAFTYDLNRSIVYTRQGNPAWAGQNRDGVGDLRPNDMFYGAAAGDSQPDWIDTNKIGIPQADEQQRLLANLILLMNRDRTPLPRFWYLPRDEKAAIVMTGDDHGTGGTAGRFDTYIADSPAGCSVANWECVRSTSYIYTSSPLTNTQAASYVGQGFEVALHPSIDNSCKPWPDGGLDALYYAPQLSAFAAKYTSVPAPVTSRTHCVEWIDWSTQPKVELAHGIRLDTNYYHYPSTWIGNKPGYMTGSGTIMRFADVDGSLIDVYQAHTHMTDESSMPQPTSVNFLLDRAVGAEGYYGMFVSLNHTDIAADANSDAIIASAQARSVPVISAKQALAWVDGRSNSAFRDFAWSGGTLTFRISVGAGATGLRAMLPRTSSAGQLSAVSRNGTPLALTVATIKGVSYAFFDAASGNYTATYS